MPKINKINHIAIAVNDIQSSLIFWRDVLGLEVAALRDVPGESARIAFLPVGSSEIELVMPAGADTGLTRFLTRHGSGMHHLCLEVDDIDAMLALLREKGVRLINETPRLGGDGRKYAFIHPGSTSGVLVELYEL